MPHLEDISTAVIIPAAGAGTRMGAPVPKQFLRVCGIPVLALTISRFLEVQAVSVVITAVPGDRQAEAEEMLDRHIPPGQRQRIILVRGGATRQQSVMAGLEAVDDRTDIVLVHDAARPFVTTDIISRCLRAAVRFGAAITAIPTGDTLKRATPDGLIAETVDRRGIWQAQTPQAARTEFMLTAYRRAVAGAFEGTDEASLLEHAGFDVALVEGSELNFKITRPDHLILAEALQGRQS